ncbi:glycosyltransferase family 4 protein [Jannaschia faecimaris]|nr:glycosyltransferase family 4 protein [Jannaschia faecimaris]
MRQIRGNIDGFQDNEIVGWVAPADGSHLSVGAYTSHGLVAQASANVFRGDLLAEGIGLGDYGFCIPLTDAIRDSVARQGGMVELRTLGKTARRLGSVRLPDRVAQNDAAQRATGTPSASRGTGTALGQLMFGDLEALADLARVARKRPPTGARSPYRPHAKMFAGTDYLKGGSLPDVMSAYAEYVRYRYKLDTPFPIHDDPENVAHFLNWYIAGYGPLRRGLRTPLSAGMLDFLNAPVVIGGQRPSLTQVTWSFLMGVKPILTAMDFNNPDWVFWAVYWWSIDQAKAMHCEDCLVPEAYIELLAGISEGWHDQPWPLTQFMIRIHAQTDGLSQLDMGREADRRELTLALMAMAARRPDYLRYLPEASIAAALKETNEGCLLDRFLALHSPDRTDAGLDAATFAALLRLRGFDLESRRFVTLTDDGHRFEAAMLPPVEEDEMVDIQLIGPFEKASGLGQATRLSQAVLAHTGYSVNPVNFGLDNPAPEGFSKTGKLSDWKRTRVNLIHLNAESIPLVYAYAPDVFSEAYNIGYFYWELDSPAACHFLGMDLLDEIWVSTDYGVEIYGPANKGRPVTNVGMCYEDLPDLDRATSRAFVKDRFGFEDGVFVFLVAFDSFSFIQRKNPIGTLRAFAKAFEGVKNVRLIIKTQNRTKVTDPVQQEIWKTVDKMVEADDRIHVLDETLVYDDLLRLKQGSDCYVSLHKSEGWGFGMIEAMNLGVPVVATGYSGNMDFCTPETAWLVDYTEVELDPDDYIFVRPGQKWAEPDVDDAARQLHAVFSDEDTRKARAEAARTLVRTGFSEQAIARRYGDRLKQILPQKPERAS